MCNTVSWIYINFITIHILNKGVKRAFKKRQQFIMVQQRYKWQLCSWIQYNMASCFALRDLRRRYRYEEATDSIKPSFKNTSFCRLE